MKILINDVKGEGKESIKEIHTLKELKELCIKHNLTLIEAKDDKRIASCHVQEYEHNRFRGCEIILQEHNDYIE